MTPSTRGRPDIPAIKLDPRMRSLVGGVGRQSDHELGLVSLLAQKPVEDQRRDGTSGVKRTDVQGSVDGVA